MSEYTPEPWKLGDGRAPYYAWPGQIIGVIDGHDFILASANQNYPNMSESNARRIVACVNACIGISTEELEKKAKYEA